MQTKEFLSKNLKPSYKLALFVQDKKKFENLAKILVSSLGLPQVGIYFSKDIPCSECEIFILFGDEGWCADASKNKNSLFNGKKVFLPMSGYLCESEIISLVEEKNSLFEFPQKIVHTYVPSKSYHKDRAENVIRLSLYYALKFLKKSSLSSVSDSVYGLILSFLVSAYDIAFSHELLKSSFAIEKGIINDSPKLLSDDLSDISTLIRNTLLTVNTETLDCNCKILLFYVLRYLEKTFSCVEHDELLKKTPYHKENYLEQRIIKAKKTSDLAYYGIIAWFENNVKLVKIVQKRILEELYDAQACYVKSSTLNSGYCYSPLLSIFLILTLEEEFLKGIFPIIKMTTIDFDWHILNTRLLIENTFNIKFFFDINAFKYSRSLIDNLEKTLFVPNIPDGYQYELTMDQYSVLFLGLQEAWREFLKSCIHMLELDCIVVSPWPGKKEFALSLRYDVDRPVTWQMIFDILKLQKRYVEGSCASWYFFADDKSDEEKIFLSEHLQEVGLHSVEIKDVFEASVEVGVTSHSGPTSSYWPGRKLFAAIDDKMKYGEFLCMQTGRPLLFYLEERSNEKWVVALHFPMETGTQDTEEVEFLEHHKKINLLVQLNGHVILGSHPDIAQNHVDAFLKKIDISKGWAAPVGKVVERCMKILNYGYLSIYYQSGKQFLYSQNSIKNLQIKNIAKNGIEKRVVIDVNAFQCKEI